MFSKLAVSVAGPENCREYWISAWTPPSVIAPVATW